MKTREELDALKKEISTVNQKLNELTEDELKYVAGGNIDWDDWDDDWGKEEEIYPEIIWEQFDLS